MRIGLISDVHGNLAALEAALDSLRRDSVDRLLCPGDLVGYGPFPNECVARVAELGATCVAGNHDLMAIGRLEYDHVPGLVRRSTEWTREELSAESRAFLEDLPATATFDYLVMAHGSLDDPTVYVTRARAATELDHFRIARRDADLLVLGHTHHPLAYSQGRGVLLDGSDGVVRLGDDERALINPGSVGQPRERRALVRYAILDLDAREVTHRAL